MTAENERYAYASAFRRRERLEQFVSDQGYCTIQELSQRFGVSEMTIRRDVARLVTEARLRAFHGGVGSLSPSDLLGVNYIDRDLRMADAKRAIAHAALQWVTPGSVLGMDAGTTVAQLASMLSTDLDLQVVTPSLPAVNILASNQGLSLTALGGVFHQESLSFAGPAALAAIANIQLDVLFLAASGLSERGVFCGNSFDAVTKRALIDSATHVVLLADSSKFSASSMARICGWEKIDRLIVDAGLSAADRTLVEGLGVSVVVAETEPAISQRSAGAPL